MNKINRLERFIINIFKHGHSVVFLIEGRRGSGKTDHALLIKEIAHKYNKVQEFATNIKVKDPPFPIEYIYNLQDLEDWAKVGSNHKLMTIDESGRAFKRRSPMSKINLELLDKLQILRKYKLSLIMIAPDASKYVDSAALGSDILDCRIKKESWKNPKLAVYLDTLEGDTLSLHDVPPTSINYNTWDIGNFRLKRDVSKAVFSDPELNILYQLGQGKTIAAIGEHRQKVNRIVRKFCRHYTENITSQVT